MDRRAVTISEIPTENCFSYTSGPVDLNVLQISCASGGVGGIDVVAGELAKWLPPYGISLVWMTNGAIGLNSSDFPGSCIERQPVWDPIGRRFGLPFPLWGPKSLRLLWHRIGASDVVHVHDFLYVPSLIALLFSAIRGRPVVITQHIGSIHYSSAFFRGLLEVLNRTVGAFVLKRAARVVFVGRPVKLYFQKFVRFRRSPCLVSNGVDHRRFRPPLHDLEAQDGPARESIIDWVRLLFVGRFVEKKGLPLLSGCVDMPGVTWTFVGEGPLPPPEGSNVILLGSLSPDGVADCCRAADLLVLPSKGEGFPLVVEEALACGTPVLVSTEVFEAFPEVDERCVFHVELRRCDTAQATHRLRRRLQQLIADPDTLAAARTFAVRLSKQWDWGITAKKYVDLYRQALRELR
jgi:glycosyltransferase involved in cell wall biosynthesis